MMHGKKISYKLPHSVSDCTLTRCTDKAGVSNKVGTVYMVISNHHPKYELETTQINLIVDSVFQNTPFEPLNFNSTVVCEKPNNNLNNFNGFL